MDPDANLIELRRLAARMMADYEDGHIKQSDANRLVELIRALDEWLTFGGFLPKPWEKGRTR